MTTTNQYVLIGLTQWMLESIHEPVVIVTKVNDCSRERDCMARNKPGRKQQIQQHCCQDDQHDVHYLRVYGRHRVREFKAMKQTDGRADRRTSQCCEHFCTVPFLSSFHKFVSTSSALGTQVRQTLPKPFHSVAHNKDKDSNKCSTLVITQHNDNYYTLYFIL